MSETDILLQPFGQPTSGLDPISSVEVAGEIVKLREDIHVTSVFVSYDRELALGIAHRIAVMHEGRILAIGTPDEIIHNPNVIRTCTAGFGLVSEQTACFYMAKLAVGDISKNVPPYSLATEERKASSENDVSESSMG